MLKINHFYSLFIIIRNYLCFLKNYFTYKHWGFNSYVKLPMTVLNKQYIYIGNNVFINDRARIEAIDEYKGIFYQPSIVINNGVTIQQNLHLTSATRVEIGENTAIVANVTISDIIHPYTSEDIHLIDMPIISKPVIIGKYCSIYNNVVVNAGVTIGDHVTIGANSVVTHDIPSYCIAVGSPARIIKKYDFNSKRWKKV